MSSEQILETWQINCRINHYLAEAVPAEAWAAKVPKSKSPCGHFTHLHNVRLMWVRSAQPEWMDGLEKLDDKATLEEVQVGLRASDAVMDRVFVAGLESGRIKGFKPHPTAYLGYLISHESFHRAQIELVLRQLGHPLSDKVAFGMWEWGAR